MPSKITVTPAMQREKANSKRAKGRRGPGKRAGAKGLRKKRSMRRKKSKDSLSTARGSEDPMPMKPVKKRKTRAKPVTHEAMVIEVAEAEVEETEPMESAEHRVVEAETIAEQAEPIESAERPVVEAEPIGFAEAGVEHAPARVEAAPKRRGRKAKVPEGESSDHPVQRHLYLTETRWIYEVVPGQRYGCPNCRFLYFGCKACKRDNFRGRTCAKQVQDPVYIRALAILNGDAPAGCELPVAAAPKRKSKTTKSSGA